MVRKLYNCTFSLQRDINIMMYTELKETTECQPVRLQIGRVTGKELQIALNAVLADTSIELCSVNLIFVFPCIIIYGFY